MKLERAQIFYHVFIAEVSYSKSGNIKNVTYRDRVSSLRSVVKHIRTCNALQVNFERYSFLYKKIRSFQV